MMIEFKQSLRVVWILGWLIWLEGRAFCTAFFSPWHGNCKKNEKKCF